MTLQEHTNECEHTPHTNTCTSSCFSLLTLPLQTGSTPGREREKRVDITWYRWLPEQEFFLGATLKFYEY